MVLKRMWYFTKNYKIDLCASLTAFILALIAYQYSKEYETRFYISSLIIVISLLVIIYNRARKRSFVYSALTWRRDKRNWIGYGDFEYSHVEKAYVITNSEQGYIHSECFGWNDYYMNFSFRINDRCLGVLLRARDLSNYVMMQINTNCVIPHIRVNGGWGIWKPEVTNFKFHEQLSSNYWYDCKICCSKREIKITICKDRQEIFNRTWDIPVGNLMLQFYQPIGSTTPKVDLPFPINLEYGSIGFRNSGSEKAFVKNVLVEKND